MNNMNNIAPIWVDVTTILHWRRPVVGIVRVEQQFCSWLIENAPPGVRFCHYDKTGKKFYSLTPDQVRAQLARIMNYATIQTATTPQRSQFRQNLRHRIKAIVGLLPPKLAISVIGALIKAKPRLVRIINYCRHHLQRLRLSLSGAPHAVPSTPNGEPLEFTPGSVYVSMGLDWDNKDMAHLYRIKQAKGLKCLLFCYDVIPVLMPQLCVADVSRQFAHYFADLAWTADRILCISDATRNDLARLLDRLAVPYRDAARVHLGGDILPGANAQTGASSAITDVLKMPYILFVSTIERRKNHEILYRAYTRLAAQGVQLPKLVFVGMPGWGVQELLLDIALDPNVKEHIIQLNHVNDADLAELYQHAQFTVYPSLYEGWGLPVAESLAFGKFCLSSNAASLPEVGQGWVEYLDPWDLPAWVERLRFLIENPAWVRQKNASIAAGYQPHSWQSTAAEIYAHAMQLAAHTASQKVLDLNETDQPKEAEAGAGMATATTETVA